MTPGFVVKLPQEYTGENEANVYRELQRDPVSFNYVLPCEIIDGKKPFLILPMLGDWDIWINDAWNLERTLLYLHQILSASAWFFARIFRKADV